VEKKNYPSMLITGGLNDPRVQYWEPAKWAAKIRDYKTDSNILVLKTNMGAGHGGASGRYDRIKEMAFEYSFVIDKIGTREIEKD
jgi:oligopeptidase B